VAIASLSFIPKGVLLFNKKSFFFSKTGKRELDRGPFKSTKYGFPSLSSEKGKKWFVVKIKSGEITDEILKNLHFTQN
jgi:hypothetical protein